MKKTILTVFILSFLITPCFAQENITKLPAPDKKGGVPLMQALNTRKSTRAFIAKELEAQVLSNLLWAASGVNREDGKRTAPSAVNWQEIDIYVAKADGLYLYNAADHQLKKVLSDDIRAHAGMQAFVPTAPVVLIYVADYSKMTSGGVTEKDRDFYSAADTGYVSQNVYLYCAGNNLATVVLGMVNKRELSKIMGLGEKQKIILTQPVGYHKSSK